LRVVPNPDESLEPNPLSLWFLLATNEFDYATTGVAMLAILTLVSQIEDRMEDLIEHRIEHQIGHLPEQRNQCQSFPQAKSSKKRVSVWRRRLTMVHSRTPKRVRKKSRKRIRDLFFLFSLSIKTLPIHRNVRY
jgi:hypothetical protein